MKIDFKLIILIIFGISTFSVFAQQDANFSQYMYNSSIINPAYSGSRENLSIYGQFRSQWVGVEGAPQTAILTVHSPFKYSKLGYGVSVISDKLGATVDNTLAVDLSYTIDFNHDYKLAFGIKASGSFLNVDYNKLEIYDITEGTDNLKNQFNPNVGAGFYLYSDRTYFGISVPNMLEYDRGNDQMYATMKKAMHFYGTFGHVFDISRDIKFKPTLLTKVVQGAPLQVDVSASFLFNERFTAGASYQIDSSVSALVGFQINEQFFVGYSYDSSVTKLANYNSGSHEIFLRFELFDKFKRFTTPRFF